MHASCALEFDGSSLSTSLSSETLFPFISLLFSPLGNGQWGYSVEQFQGLQQTWELLNSEEPLPFQWLESSTRDISYPLWPFKKGSQVTVSETLSESENDEFEFLSDTDSMEIKSQSASEDRPWVQRGPGMLLAEGDVNPWSNEEVTRRNAADPMRGFQFGMMVLIEPVAESDEAKNDGFWLGQLVEPPQEKLQDARAIDAKDYYVGVHWWARKKGSTRLSWCDWGCKWEAQKGHGGSLSIDAISIGAIGCEIQMNTDGTFRKDRQNLTYFNYYRSSWCNFDGEEDWKK